MKDENPIFVCGLARSGTSWLSKSLGQSDELVYLREAWLIERLKQLYDWYSEIQENWHVTPWYERNIDKQQFIKSLSHFYESLLLQASDGKRFIEKTPHWNATYLEFLYELFPDAYYILIYRDGRNFVASLEAKKQTDRQSFNFLRECKRWSETMILFDKIIQSKKIKNIYIIRYENMLKQFDDIFVELCNFLKIKPFSPESIKPNSSFENDTNIPNFNYRWESWSEEKKNIFKEYAGKQLIKLNYVESDEAW